jgi:Ca2+-binding EF-hand superfamily protein
VSFDVTDYHPDGNEWSSDLVPHIHPMSAPSSPIHQNPEIKDLGDTTEYVLVTLDIHDDSVSVVSVVPEKKSAVKKPPRRLKFDSSEALKGVKMFISMTDSGWMAVEKRFDKMTAKTDGLLIRSKFGECLGINSKEFALELLDSLVRRWDITRRSGISKCELREFWEKIIDQRFGSRLKMFFTMADKDGNCRLTEEEVREFTRLTASANNQSTTQKTTDEYAATIMEELDIYKEGYITMEILELLLLDVERLPEVKPTEETKKPTKRWYKVLGDISSSSFIPCLMKTASTKKT